MYPESSDIEEVESWFYQEAREGVRIFPNQQEVNEEYIVAETYNSKVCYFFPIIGSELGYKIIQNNFKKSIAIEMLISSYLVSNHPMPVFNNICFYGPELDLFYPINKGIVETYKPEEQRCLVEFAYGKEFQTQPIEFQVNGDDYSLDFSYEFTQKYSVLSPVFECKTRMKVSVKNTISISVIPELYQILRKLISYCSWRTNVNFSKVKVYDQPGPYHNRAYFISVMDDEDSVDSEALNKRKIIRYSEVEDILPNLITDLETKKLYLRAVPKSFKDSRMYDISKFILIMAGFDWEFRRAFPDFNPRSPEGIKAEENAKQVIKDQIGSTTGKEKKLWKMLLKRVDDTTPEDRIKYLADELDEIITPLSNCYYQGSYDLDEITKRVSKQRNDFAHGNLDNPIDIDAYSDVRWLEMLTMIVKLYNYKLNNETIYKIVERLFLR